MNIAPTEFTQKNLLLIQNYSLRERAHNREIPFTKSVTFRKTFIMKMLYLESYWI